MGIVPTTMRFSDVKQGMRARVTRVHANSPEVRRLQEMGLTEGTEFTVIKVAPFGDPVEIDLRGYRLCLRRKESSDFEIELVE